MAAAEESGLVYLFAGMLALAAVLLVFIPVFRYAADFAVSRRVLALLLALTAVAGIVALVLVTVAAGDPAFFLPIIAVTVALRIAAPVALYRRIRDRFESNAAWGVLQVLTAAAFLGFVAILGYGLLVVAAGGVPVGVAIVSEQLVAAIGAASLLVRMAVRVRPHEATILWPVWLGSLLFGIAFVAILPYAVPAFTSVYAVSGLVGWGVGSFVAIRDR